MGFFKALFNVVAFTACVMDLIVKGFVIGLLMIPVASVAYLIYLILWSL